MLTNEEVATIAARALHTLETLRDWGIAENDDSVPTLFVLQTVDDLKHLLKATGVARSKIDIGDWMNGEKDKGQDVSRLRAWNAGEPLKVMP